MNTELLQNTAAKLVERFSGYSPACTAVLGSGWGEAVDPADIVDACDYGDIPLLGQTGVEGHRGRLLLIRHAGSHAIVFQGRRHWYEGIGWETIAFPAYLTLQMDIPVILLTNSAGSLSREIQPGSLMIIDDHINAMGVNPLAGPHDPVWGPRFPDQTTVYDISLRSTLDAVIKGLEISSHHGVYAAMAGPAYETPAEVRALKTLGCSAVGMSTVPEAILANSAGLRVAGVSCISNYAAGVSEKRLSHDDVMEQTSLVLPHMRKLMSLFLSRIPDFS